MLDLAPLVICRRCDQAKPFTREHFYVDARAKGVPQYRQCKSCRSLIDAEQLVRKRAAGIRPRKRSSGEYREYNLHRYGLTEALYQRMLAEQHGKCASCGALGSGRSRLGIELPMHIDHDHATGVVRGLLCHNCNILIGCAGDSVERLQLAAAYLEAHRG